MRMPDDQRARLEAAARQRARQAAPKNPGAAAVLSFLVCGLGQVYNGQIGKGLLLFVGCVGGVLTLHLGIGLLLAPACWLVGIVDAYRTAERWNAQRHEGDPF